MQEGQTDFLDDLVRDEPAQPAPPAAEQAPPPAPEAKADDRPRNPDGTFAKKADEPETVAKGDKPAGGVQPAPAQPAPPAEPEGDRVPIAALKAEREKRQALEAELAKLRAAPSQTPTAPKGPEFTPPQVDFEEDPRSYFETKIHAIKMQQSQLFAVQQSSAEEVAEAWAAFDQACQSDPAVSAYSQTLTEHPHPIGEVLKWHRQQKELRMLSEAGGLDKLREKWLADELAKLQAEQPKANGAVQPAPTPKAPPPVPPPSLAKGGAGSVDQPEMPNENQVFAQAFPGVDKPRKR